MAYVNRRRIAPNAERLDNDQKPGQSKTVFYARSRWVLDSGQYVVWKKTVVGDDLDVESAHFKVRSDKAQARFLLGPVRKIIRIEQRIGTVWTELDLPLLGYSIVGETEDIARYRWNFGALKVQLRVNEVGGKWTYMFTAHTNGRYRVKILHRCPTADSIQTYSRKNGGAMYLAVWTVGKKRYRYNWIDMPAVKERVVGTDLGLLSPAKNMLAGETVLLDPTFSDNADWGADVDNGGSKYPNDGSDYCGDDTSAIYRDSNKFTISALDPADTVDQVDFDIYVDTVTNSATSTWIEGGYNGDGQADPEADSAATMYARCDVSADNYLTGITDYRNPGQYSHTLGPAANADVEAARDAGTIFSVAIKMTTEGSANDRTVFREYTHATTPPKLTVISTAAGTAVGQVVETDSSQAVTPLKVVAVGQATETDLAQPITAVGAQIVAVGQVTESDLAQAISSAKLAIVAQVAQVDIAQAVATAKTVAIAQATEANTSQSITTAKTTAVGQVTETDVSQAVGAGKAASVNQVSETDLAQTVTPSGATVIAIGQVVETALAQAITRIKQLGVSQAVETDSAIGATVVKGLAVNQVLETDSAIVISRAKALGVSQALETDLSQPIAVYGAVIIGYLLGMVSATPSLAATPAASPALSGRAKTKPSLEATVEVKRNA